MKYVFGVALLLAIVMVYTALDYSRFYANPPATVPDLQVYHANNRMFTVDEPVNSTDDETDRQTDIGKLPIFISPHLQHQEKTIQ